VRLLDESHHTIHDDTDPRDFGGDIERDASYPDDHVASSAQPWPLRSGTLHSANVKPCAACGKHIPSGDERWSDAVRARVCAPCMASPAWLQIIRNSGAL
jgi:hypothetical protein